MTKSDYLKRLMKLVEEKASKCTVVELRQLLKKHK